MADLRGRLAVSWAFFGALSLLGLTCAGASAAEARVVPAGTYSGASRGEAEDVKVEVTVADGRIAEVKVTEHKEPHARTAPKDVPFRIVRDQSTKVDAVSGATVMSKAIMRATDAALDGAVPLRLADVPDGTYTGTSRGQTTDVTVAVTVRGGKIEAVKLKGKADAPKSPEAREAQKVVPERIVEKQSARVDAHPGAEATSMAVMRAVEAALDSAVPRTLKAGGK